jgi:hypothetical protein
MLTNCTSRARFRLVVATLTLAPMALFLPGCLADEAADRPVTTFDAGTDDAAAPPPAPQDASAAPCPAPRSGPTPHSGELEGEVVWAADASPHVVSGELRVRNGAKLTIEPCAVVRFAPNASIVVASPLTPNTGTLVAEGTAERPIRFLGEDASDGGVRRWGGVFVHAPGTVRLAHATFEGGGAGTHRGATLHARGDSTTPAKAALFVDTVTIKGSLGAGVVLDRAATFAAGSRALVVTESGSDEHPYPLVVGEHALDALPTGTYTGNRINEILIADEVVNAASGIQEDTTIHDRGVPYHVGTSPLSVFRVGRENGLVTLTIEPGVVLKFEPRMVFAIEHATGAFPATGVVRAVGTADKPIVFTSAAPTPQAGDWKGLWFGGIPRNTNALEHVRIEYAGYDCACTLSTCSAIDSHRGAILFTREPPSAFLTNSVIAHSGMHGVVRGYDGSLVDFRPTNRFEAIAGCVQTRPRNADTTCPSPRPACE